MSVLVLWVVLGATPVSAWASSSLEGLYISSSSSLFPDVLFNGQVQSAYQSSGKLSDDIDFSSVLHFYMWAGLNWHNQTLYLVVQAQNFVVVPLYYDRVPTPSQPKRISDSLTFEEYFPPSESVREFYISFECIFEGRDTVLLQLKPYESRDISAEIHIQKLCSKGPRSDLNIWVNSEQAVFAGIPNSDWVTRTHSLTGSVEIGIQLALGNLFIATLAVTGQVGMELRGPAARGGLVTNRTELTLIPTWKEEQQGGVYLTLRIPPYTEVHLTWTQVKPAEVKEDKAAEYLQSLYIGSAPGLSDIVHTGQAQFPYISGLSIPPTTFFSLVYLPIDSPFDLSQVRLTFDTHILSPVLTWKQGETEQIGRLIYHCIHAGL